MSRGSLASRHSAPCSLGLAVFVGTRALLCSVNTKHKQKQTVNLAIFRGRTITQPQRATLQEVCPGEYQSQERCLYRRMGDYINVGACSTAHFIQYRVAVSLHSHRDHLRNHQPMKGR